MSGVDFGTHAELEQRRRYPDPTGCTGRMLVVAQGDIWELECACCRFMAGLHRREVDPMQHSARLLERRRQSSRIPGELRGLVLPHDGAGVAVAARRWAATELSGLVLTGPVGTGKTYLAAAAAWARIAHGPLRWFSVPFLFARLGLAFSDDGRQEALNALAATDALVLDDIDKTRPTEYAAEQLFCAIDTRVTAGAGLLVTTNLAPSALAERFPDPYGEAIVSRLVGHCETFALEGGDRRLERRVA